MTNTPDKVILLFTHEWSGEDKILSNTVIEYILLYHVVYNQFPEYSIALSYEWVGRVTNKLACSGYGKIAFFELKLPTIYFSLFTHIKLN